jgi:phosphatidylglycerol:prolipoprotein diacylglycerol transferase
MYPTLPLGPFTLPTGPILAMLATIVALELAGRTGRRLGIHPDDVWNTGLMALLAGLIVARLWTIIQFFDVYRAEPLLVFSLRPSGFAFWPGVVAAVVVAFANMVRLALDPARMGASFAVGLVGGAILINVSAYLTGAALGAVTDLPWAARYFIERVHPVGLYRAVGLALVLALLLLTLHRDRPLRTIWLSLLGSALVYLVADAWLRDPALLGAFRRSQVLALLIAVFSAVALALEAASFARRAGQTRPATLEPGPAAPT